MHHEHSHGRHGGRSFGRHMMKAMGYGPRGGHFAGFGFGEGRGEGPKGGHGGGFGGGRGGGHGGGHGGRRRGRLFSQAELQQLLLALIAQTPRHGYELIREIEAMAGGEYAPSPGVVYPALTYMEETGLIAPAEADGRSKAFEATEAGRDKAATEADEVEALKSRLTALAARSEQVDPAPVRRAMHALKTAAIDRLSQDGADRAIVLQVADAIDEATRKIERIEA